MKRLIIGERAFTLDFNMLAIDAIDEAAKGGDIKTFVETNFVSPRKIPDVLPVVLSPNNPDVPDADWFKANMTMGKAAAVSQILMSEFVESMKMETETDPDYEKDEVLDEIQKKDKADG